MKAYKAYVDGSYRDGQAGYAVIIVDDQENVFHTAAGRFKNEASDKMWNVAAELKAAMTAVAIAKGCKIRVHIVHDYAGIAEWAKEVKPWKTKNEFTRAYRQFMLDNKEFIEGFTRVQGHSGDKFNEMADQLALAELN